MSVSRFQLNTTERLNFREIPEWVGEVAEKLLESGYQAYLVGGAVRDLLQGKQPGDWDLASDALPDQVEEIFLDTVPTGKQFGTITIIIDAHSLEITTLREELAYSDGRRPEVVRFGKEINTDLARRDFTINAMAYDCSNQELVDPFGGKKDLGNRLLKSVGDPQKRFAEDGLRMFRFYRFIGTMDLRPQRLTEQVIRPEFAMGVSLERIREEFSKLLLGKWVRRGLNGLNSSGLLNIFLPELTVDIRGSRSNYIKNKLWEHLLTTTEEIKPELHLRLAALLHDIAKPATFFEDQTGVHFYGHDEKGAETAQIVLERLRYPRKIIDKVVNLIHWHMFNVNFQTGDGAIRRLIAKVGPENIPDLLELRRADIVATGKVDYQTWENWQSISKRILSILNQESALNELKPLIDGSDLIKELQLQPGPLIGEILAYLKEVVLDDPSLNQRELLLNLARKYLDERLPH